MRFLWSPHVPTLMIALTSFAITRMSWYKFLRLHGTVFAVREARWPLGPIMKFQTQIAQWASYVLPEWCAFCGCGCGWPHPQDRATVVRYTARSAVLADDNTPAFSQIAQMRTGAEPKQSLFALTAVNADKSFLWLTGN